jgi:hypothetical protein
VKIEIETTQPDVSGWLLRAVMRERVWSATSRDDGDLVTAMGQSPGRTLLLEAAFTDSYGFAKLVVNAPNEGTFLGQVVEEVASLDRLAVDSDIPFDRESTTIWVDGRLVQWAIENGHWTPKL